MSNERKFRFPTGKQMQIHLQNSVIRSTARTTSSGQLAEKIIAVIGHLMWPFILAV